MKLLVTLKDGSKTCFGFKENCFPGYEGIERYKRGNRTFFLDPTKLMCFVGSQTLSVGRANLTVELANLFQQLCNCSQQFRVVVSF